MLQSVTLWLNITPSLWHDMILCYILWDTIWYSVTSICIYCKLFLAACDAESHPCFFICCNAQRFNATERQVMQHTCKRSQGEGNTDKHNWMQSSNECNVSKCNWMQANAMQRMRCNRALGGGSLVWTLRPATRPPERRCCFHHLTIWFASFTRRAIKFRQKWTLIYFKSAKNCEPTIWQHCALCRPFDLRVLQWLW